MGRFQATREGRLQDFAWHYADKGRHVRGQGSGEDGRIAGHWEIRHGSLLDYCCDFEESLHVRDAQYFAILTSVAQRASRCLWRPNAALPSLRIFRGFTGDGQFSFVVPSSYSVLIAPTR